MIKIKQVDELDISLDIVIVSDDITANDLQKYQYIDETIDIATDAECDKILDDIVKIIKSFGYYIVKRDRSNQSNSLYFVFCKENEFDKEEVNLFVALRVSDHDLPQWEKDKGKQDAKDRQLHTYQGIVNDFKWLNKNLKDDEEIPVEQIYIKYENEFYSEWQDVYDKIRKKLEAFTNKHK